MSLENRLPPWFKQKIPSKEKIHSLKNVLRRHHLHTVCEDAHCPNIGRCWEKQTATFMILGNICTRSCRFCAINTGIPQEIDLKEPKEVALAVKTLNLKYAVITSVSRDDLPDYGAKQFARTIYEIRQASPDIKIEVLIPDFSGQLESLKTVLDLKPDVLGHNMETVPRLSQSLRPQSDYDRSLSLLKNAKKLNEEVMTKSGLMVGLGETNDEIKCLMVDLIEAGCEILTIGQYLAPSKGSRHFSVQRYARPEEFDDYRQLGLSLGFKSVMSGPLVRSSFLAEEVYGNCLNSRKQQASEDDILSKVNA